MKRVVVALVALGAVGCFSPKPCEQDADCTGGVCDRELKVCVTADGGAGGGTGGGAMGGGGGGGGASDAGGGTGGGGSMMDCAGGCAAWQTCQPGGGGTCRDVTVTIESPRDGDEYSAGGQVRVVARVTEWDGGAWGGASIPAAASAGATAPASLLKQGTQYVGDFGLAMSAGQRTLTVGWPAAKASVDVLVKACEVSCQPWQECRAAADGGSCQDLGLVMTWERPLSGEEFGPAAAQSVPVVLRVTRGDGGTFGGTVPFALTGGASGVLTANAGVWTATVDAGPANGARTLTAGWDGGPMVGPRTFNVVATPPSVALYVEAAPTRATEDTDEDGVARWKKSESTPIQVESNRELASASFMNVGVSMSTRCTRPCAGAWCRCYEVDLARQPLVLVSGQLTGTVGVTVSSATDVLGNTATSIPSVSIPVTRFKWRRQLASASAGSLSVAIQSDGTVYAGARTGLVGTELKAVRPDGGVTTVYSATDWAVTAGPMVGAAGDVYVAQTNGTDSRFAQNPGPSGQVVRCLNQSGTFDGDLALVSPGAAEVVVGVRSDGRFVPGTTSCDTAFASGFAGRPSVIALGTTAFFAGGSSAPIWKAASANAIPTVSGSVSTGTLFPSNLFVVGSVVGGGGGGPAIGGVFGFVDAATLPASTTNATPGMSAGGPAVVGGTMSSPVVYYGDNAQTVRALAMTATATFPSAATASSALGNSSTQFGSFAPVAGRGGKLYVVGRDGVVRGLSSSTLTEEWSWGAGVLPTNGSIAQLNLDKNRSAADPCGAGQPGVLYVAATKSNTTTLYALLVDSAGVDGAAPWPRHQHDPANTGNAATSLAPWTCP